MKASTMKYSGLRMLSIAFAMAFAFSILPSVAVSAERGTVMQIDPADASRVSDLFPRTGKGFTNKKETVRGNDISILVDDVLQKRVVSMYAKPRRGNTVSKSSVVHEGFSATAGTTFVLSMQVKLRAKSPGGVFLVDLECSDCWPKNSLLPNKSPGIRLYIDKSSGRLAVDRGKIGMRSNPLRSRGNAPRFPTDRWVNLVWRIEIDNSDRAVTQAFVDGKLFLEARGATLMDDRIFRKYGVQLEKFRYNYAELGITANESQRDLEMRIGKVKIELE